MVPGCWEARPRVEVLWTSRRGVRTGVCPGAYPGAWSSASLNLVVFLPATSRSKVRGGGPSLARGRGCTCDRPYPAAIDYSEGALLEARSLLRATAAFVEDARAYLRGQLAGGPIQEDVLW